MSLTNRPAQGGPTETWIRENSMLWGTVRVPRSHEKGNGAIIGGIGSGKTTLFMINILSILGYIPDRLKVINAFVFDPKNQLYRALLARDLGLKVILTNVMDRRAWAWAMWRDVKDPAGAEQFAYDVLPDERKGSENQFFTDAPRHIFAGVLRELVRLGRPWTLRQAFLLSHDWAYAGQLFARSPDPAVRLRLALISPDQGVTKANLLTSLITKLKKLETYAALMEHAPGYFSIGQVTGSDAVVVFGSDFRFADILGPMNALIMKVLKQRLLSQGDDEENRRRHYLFIDEFPKLNYNSPAEDFPDFVELGRSKGVRVTIVAQTPEQIKGLYGPEMMSTIFACCQNKLILRVSDFAGATECSNMLPFFHGYEWLQNRGKTSSKDGDSTNHGASETRADYPLVPPDVFQHLPLADWDLGWRGYALDASMRRVPAWSFRVTPQFLSEHLGGVDQARDLISNEQEDLTLPYEDCTRTAREQYLEELNPCEVQAFGLDFHP